MTPLLGRIGQAGLLGEEKGNKMSPSGSAFEIEA